MISSSPLAGDFSRLITPSPHIQVPRSEANSGGISNSVIDTHGTTVIAVKYRDGVLNVADRRATAGMGVMYDRAEKIRSPKRLKSVATCAILSNTTIARNCSR